MKHFIVLLIMLLIKSSGCKSPLPVKDIPNVSDTPPQNLTHAAIPEKTTNQRPWRSAVFKGIKIGKDTREMARAKFGKPTWSGDPQGQDGQFPEIWDNYENIDDLHKKITVMSSQKDGTVLAIVSSQGSLSVEAALRIFGDDYVRINYSPIPSTEISESIEMVEDPEGLTTQIEYRGAGIIHVGRLRVR